MLEIVLKFIAVLAGGWVILIVSRVCSETAESRKNHHRDKMNAFGINPFGREE